MVNQWLERPSRDNTVNLNGVVPVCGGSPCLPIPVVLRPPDEYLWEESPYQLTGGWRHLCSGSSRSDELLVH